MRGGEKKKKTQPDTGDRATRITFRITGGDFKSRGLQVSRNRRVSWSCCRPSQARYDEKWEACEISEQKVTAKNGVRRKRSRVRKWGQLVFSVGGAKDKNNS